MPPTNGRFARVPEFVALALPGLCHSASKVYIALALHADFRTKRVSASYETIASWAGVNRKSVHKAIQELGSVGALSWRTGNKGKPNSFFLPNELPTVPTDGTISDEDEYQETVRGSPKNSAGSVPTGGTRIRKKSIYPKIDDSYFEELRRQHELSSHY